MNYIALAVWTKPDMTIAESIGVALVGICVVLLELALLALFIKLLSKIISVFGRKKKAEEPAPSGTAPAPEATPAAAPVNGPVLTEVQAGAVHEGSEDGPSRTAAIGIRRS